MSTPWLTGSAILLVVIGVVLLAVFRRHVKVVETSGKNDAERALLEARRGLDEARDMWHPVLEAAEEARALRARNHFGERLAHAYSAHPGPPPFNRRKDDPK